MEEKKLCSNCEYASISSQEEPCKSCRNKSNWVDADISTPFQTGDIVTVEYSKDVYVYLCDNLIINIHADITIDRLDMRITDPVISSTTCKYSILSAGIDILKTKTNYFLKYAGPVAMHKVHYATAADITEHNANARKDHPVFLSNWISSKIIKEEVNNMDKIKDFKAGDIVVEKKCNGCGSTTNIYIYLCTNLVLRVPSYVIICSQCSYRFSDYINELTLNNSISMIGDCYLEFASSEVITDHDHRAKTFYISETLNEWFSNLIKKKDGYSIPTVYPNSDNVRYDKYPTLNANFIKRVIFSDPATIVFWDDGTKTVVKTQDGEKYDKEKGLAMAIAKRVFGNERDYYHVFKRWMRKGEERHEET